MAFKYPLGARVLCVKVPDGNRDVLGKMGTVLEQHENEDWTPVKWDNFHNGWGEEDSCWSCPEGTITLVDMENE